MKISFFVFIFFIQTSLAWSQANPEDYPNPMRFNVIGDTVNQLPPRLDYNLESQKSLILGDLVIDSRTLGAQIGSMEALFPQVIPFLSEEDRRETVLLMKWPSSMLQNGLLEAIGRSGKVLWTQNVREVDVNSFQDFKTEVRTRMAERIRPAELDKIGLFSYLTIQRGFSGVMSQLFDSKEIFRFCISRTTTDGLARFCLPFSEIGKQKNKLVLLKAPEPPVQAKVILFQKSASLKNSLLIKKPVTIQFLADLADGSIVEFISKPPQTKIAEMFLDDKNIIQVIGIGTEPNQKHTLISKTKDNFLTRAFGWQETIGDFRQYWQTNLDAKMPYYYVRGAGGGLFRQEFVIQRLPREDMRPSLAKRTPDSTYSNNRKIFILAAPKTTISSEENEAVDRGEDEYKWHVKAENRGEMNVANILVSDGKDKYKAFYEIYKGFPGELAVRSSAILGTGGNVLATGEVALNLWFDTILTWTNYYLSSQRWGVSAKYFTTVTPLKLNSANFNFAENLKNNTIDLKYRFEPGVWNRDESWGLIFGLSDLKYALFANKQMGLGFFWARSMPKGLDDFFNKWSLFRYPKWVDLEYISYFKSNSVGVTNQVEGNWSLNFHGKVLWSKNFFGEAGFGIRSYQFNQTYDNLFSEDGLTQFKNLKFKFASLYGTVGFGYQF